MHVPRVLPLLLLVFGGLVSAVGAVEKGDQVRHELEVETTGGKVKVRLMVENRGDTTIYVPREIAAGNEITGRRFDLRGPRGTPIDYTGMMVKRGALTASDYQAVAPHTVHMNTIDISSAYAFRKGRHAYTVGYDGPWLPNTTQLNAVRYSPAAPVEFSFTR